MNNHLKSIVCALTTFCLLFTLTAPAMAAMVSTDQVRDEIRVDISRDQILTALQREDVRSALVLKGVSLEDVQTRINALTDVEVASLSQNLNSLPVGAGAGGTILTVLLILVILDIIGVTNIFSFIN